MTQVKSAQNSRGQVASTPRATGRTLAQRRADFEAQMRDYTMALTKSELRDVSERLHDLRAELAERRGLERVAQYAVAAEANIPPRTFQSWENGEVEPRGEGYQPLADYYSAALGRRITKNWIMFGQDEEPAAPSPRRALSNGSSTSDGEVRELRRQLEALRAELLAELARVRTEQAGLRRLLQPGERSPAAPRS